jgi:hypothetical protein
MSKTVPEVRVNKLGVPVIKHVLAEGAAAPVVASKALPAPALSLASSGAIERLPALRGKNLKEAKEIQRLAQNGDQKYEDTITAFFLENDLRSMRIYDMLTAGGSYNHPDSKLALELMETMRRLDIGTHDDEVTFVGKSESVLNWGVQCVGDDFIEWLTEDEDTDSFIRFMAENWEQSDEIMKVITERGLEDASAEEFIGIWNDMSNLASPSLRDGVI